MAMKRTRSNSDSSRPKRSVSFAADEEHQEHPIDCIPRECHEDCFYGKEELKAQHAPEQSEKEVWQKSMRLEEHSYSVITEWKRSKNESALRSVSKESSREDRHKAIATASAQAKEQGHKPASKGIKKSLSNSFKLVVRKGTRNAAA